MDFITITNWVMVVVALTGAFLNVRRKWYGFVFWLVSNAWWTVHHSCLEEWPQAFTFAVFWLLSAYGISAWRKTTKEVEETIQQTKSETRQISNKQISNLLQQNISMSSFIRNLPNKQINRPINKGLRFRPRTPKAKGVNHGK